MTKVDCYEDLLVWQKAHRLVLNIYEITEKFPGKERFGLTMQLRRAAASVPANISEGSNRQYTKELIQFLFVARGSLGETEYFLRLSKDLNYISDGQFNELYQKSNEVGRMISGLIKSLRGDRGKG